MVNDYFTVNIHEYLISDELKFALNELLASFDCSKRNKEVDGFLKGSAIAFADKGQSATYLVFADEGNPRLVGYFTLAVKAITVPVASVSSKNAQKIERVCRLNEEESTYHFLAYLLAQLGKNYALDKDLRISGKRLLDQGFPEHREYKLPLFPDRDPRPPCACRTILRTFEHPPFLPVSGHQSLQHAQGSNHRIIPSAPRRPWD